MTRSLFALALLAATSSAVAAPTSYVFDSVSKFDLGARLITLTGILQGESTPTTLTWVDNTNGDNRYPVNRCVPVLLTMIEKPGRYLLNLSIDPAELNVGTISCGLELKN
ncbi:hypothetical protein GCM10011487_35370 [Steroidobacter agaridevorans]|uniref:Ig-like domain-containing protein n=1 Tax=Steroidobacter agaridevorans TaxID=2695856 RepID=A0A829YE50_9GAMM|nr:hypothetical protein [Steroidobacter agaridevorans]GFE81537.1 hypothetical protein GCM10011487_35370 [Steroidobacter agaridevorans]GFE90282.1 hypothetical protein GCM10011488_52360 [Steroidobacter agaridevorans]